MSRSLQQILLSGLLWPVFAAAQDPFAAETAKALRHFDDMKFGMFIHWGLYSVPAREWKGEYVRSIGEWIMFRKRIPVGEYEQLAKQFNPVKFTGGQWAQLANDSGMRYMVITSKHHDGFAIFASSESEYNIVDATPFRIDPMRELAAACAKQGIDFGFYYSQDQDWHEARGRGNNWDFPEKRDAQPYLQGKVFPQVKELLSGYGKPGLIDTWGYKKNDTNWKDLRDLVAKLADIVSKGGNYSLNVGPTAEGVIPEASQSILRSIGKWLQTNGESIYGTSPSPFYIQDITWRATTKPGRIYLHILNWPGTQLDITQASFLGNRSPVRFRQQGSTVFLQLPAQPLDPWDTVVVLEIGDSEPGVAERYRPDRLPARLNLHAWTARLRGEEIRYDWSTSSASNFKRFERETNALSWYPYTSLDGIYDVEITCACDDAIAGSTCRLASDGRGAGPAVEGAVEPTGGKFVTRTLTGSLPVKPETAAITLALAGSDKSAGVKVRGITLIRR